jgi:uncharacterized protein
MTISRGIVRKIEFEAKKYFVGANGCHDWTHVERVRKLALRIGRKVQADLKVVEISALLHDISRKKEDDSKGLVCHAEQGGQEAKKILQKLNFDSVTIRKITHAISTHRFRKGSSPESLEAKVLYDADKLDSIGAMGIARTFLFAGGSFGSGVMYTGNEKRLAQKGQDCSYTKEDSGYLEYEIKLKHIKDKILTRAGKAIAKERHDFMKKYFVRFWEEINGLK